MPDTTPTTPAVWSDTDPLMQAIAAAVWEQCATDLAASITCDDPRTIAAVAATVARLVLGTTDQQPTTAECTCITTPEVDDSGQVLHGSYCMTVIDQPPAPPAEACTEHGAACHTRDWPAPGAVTDPAEAHRLSLSEALGLGTGAPWDAIHDRAAELGRLADEAQPATDQPTVHRCNNCEGIDPDTCFNNPHRPPEQCPAAEFEDYGQQCQKPVGHELHTFEEQPPAADRPDTETEAAPLAVGDRYECRTRARTVTVTRLWVDEYGADAVAFEWRGGMSGSALTAEMFHQLYRPAP
jgi:hypothetical protein